MTSTPGRGHSCIEDYAAIGNRRSIALVARDGSIDWCALGRMDAPPVLARLLDEGAGGFLRTAPAEPALEIARRYVADTNVLETTLRTARGALRITDTMSLEGECIVRRLEALGGDVRVLTAWRPTFDFVRPPDVVELGGSIAVARRAGEIVSARAPSSWRDVGSGMLLAERTLSAGEVAVVALGDERARVSGDEELLRATTTAEGAWRRWASALRCPEQHRDAVVRSALALSLLRDERTGALVAAPTTSLPEAIGGGRNWDYRFTWIRDAALVLDALMRLGRHDEAMQFWKWVEALPVSRARPLRILYTLAGRSPPSEVERDDVAGHRGSRPVRVGNAAAQQTQLDVAGYLVDAAYVCETQMRMPHEGLAPVLRALADETSSRWREPDRSIWEMRARPAHHLASKLMSWVALDRALGLHRRGWLSGDAVSWRRERDAVRRAILERGYDDRRGAFVQTLGGDALDAAALLVPIVGFLPGDDPRVRSTLEAVRRELTHDHLVRRYLVDDGQRGEEGAWVLCSFWLAEALALAGMHDEAGEQLAAVISRANDVGLFAEQIDPGTGAFLGNFPQAFSHLALVRAADVVARAAARGTTRTRSHIAEE